MIKALFFDVDGTLVSFKTHKIPERTIQALQMAHDQGVKIFTATGRPRQLLNNIPEVEHLMDGYILATGALCIYGETVVREDLISHEEVLALVDHCRRHNISSVVVGKKDIQFLNRNEIVDHAFFDMLKVTYNKYDVPLEEVINQGCYRSPRSSPRSSRRRSCHSCRGVRQPVGILRSATSRRQRRTKRGVSVPWQTTLALTSARPWRLATGATTAPCFVLPALVWRWAMR